MSFVLAYADRNRIVIAGDGRETDEQGRIISDHVSHTEKLNPAIILGYVGNPDFCRRVADETRTTIKNQTKTGTCSATTAARYLRSAAVSLYKETYGICSFVLGGRNRYGKPILVALGSETGFSFIRRMAYEDSVQKICLCPYESKIPVEENLSMYMEGLLPKEEAWRFAFTATLKDAAREDPRIGGEMTVEMIWELPA